MNLERQRRIEQRAYALWQAEGQPHGRHEEHWRQAAREIEAEEVAGVATTRSARRASSRAAVKPATRSPQRRRKA